MSLSRTEYVNQKIKELEDWNDELALLEANAHKTGEGLKQQYRDKLVALHVKKEAVQKQLDTIWAATDDSWEHLKGDTENVWTALKDSVANFRSHF